MELVDSRCKPSLILGAAVREVDGAVGCDIEVVGKAQRHTLHFIHEHCGLASLWAYAHQP